MRTRLLALLLYAVVAVVIAPLAASAFTLDEVVAGVESDYPDVRHLSSDALAKTMARDDIVLFDVREADEFAVSHLPGALRISPDIEQSEFIRRFAGKVRDRQVVFYCSVGVRSSHLAENVQDALVSRGARSVHNLKGGIFGWHNERRALVNTGGSTDHVHPFSRRWGVLVDRGNLASYKPRN